jgi:hypothetical protein
MRYLFGSQPFSVGKKLQKLIMHATLPDHLHVNWNPSNYNHGERAHKERNRFKIN